MKLWRAWPFTVRGMAAFVVGIASMSLAQQYNLLPLRVVAFVFLALPLLSLGALWLVPGGRSLRRRFGTEVIPSGRDTTVELQVTTGHSNGALTEWHDELGPGLSAAAHGVLITTGDATLVHYQLHAGARGPRSVGPFKLTETDGFGLARRITPIGDVSSIVVAPAVIDLAPFAVSVREATGALHSATSHLGEGADNLIARPYVAGDSMRRIHWRATAHRGELMVRQEERETTPQATVVMDRDAAHWPALARTFGADKAFEAALALTASAVLRLLSEGFAVDVLDASGDVLCESVVDQEDVTGMLAALARLQPATHATRATPVLTGGPVIWVTSPSADLTRLTNLSASLPVLFVVADGAPAEPALSGWHVAALDASEGISGIPSAWERALEGGTRASA